MHETEQSRSGREAYAAPPEATNSTGELEAGIVCAVLELEAKGKLPVGLSNSVHRYIRAGQELKTHMRGPLVLSHHEYAEVAASLVILREQIVDFCLRHNPFE